MIASSVVPTVVSDVHYCTPDLVNIRELYVRVGRIVLIEASSLVLL